MNTTESYNSWYDYTTLWLNDRTDTTSPPCFWIKTPTWLHHLVSGLKHRHDYTTLFLDYKEWYKHAHKASLKRWFNHRNLVQCGIHFSNATPIHSVTDVGGSGRWSLCFFQRGQGFLGRGESRTISPDPVVCLLRRMQSYVCVPVCFISGTLRYTSCKRIYK